MDSRRRTVVCLTAALSMGAIVSAVSGQTGPQITWERVEIRATDRDERFVDCALPDLDGDGDLDLALIKKQGADWFNSGRPEDAAPPVETWLNDGSGRFTPVSIHPFATDRWSAVAFDWADADGDGDDDVVLWGGGPWSEVHPMENRGGSFDYFDITYSAWPALWNAGARWIDVDGKPALFVFRGTGELYVFEDPACGVWPQPLGSSRSAWAGFLQNDTEAFEILDYDSDGDLDAVLAPWTVGHVGLRVLENQHALMDDVTHARFAGDRLTQEGGSIALGDLDGDGLEDLVLGDMGPLPYGASHPVPGDVPDLVFQRTKSGFRREPVVIETPFHARSERCFVADFDLDGRQDILFIGVVNSASYLALNRGEWEFELHSSHRSRLPYLAGDTAEVGDLNGDGRPDLFIAGLDRLTVYLNKPASTTERR